ncbi:heterokaryon incompatibility protein-domain-containing protein [Bisporella sp. PMI_857]|nr:heterokaryon incompatibility protein-domain-containing protein [Bisporella sp. PMI_857]
MTDLGESYSTYQYRPLPSNKFIRLLELYPGHATDDIDCSLHQTELDGSSKYEAVSYAWGDLTNKANICCDGKIITVTQNLKYALIRLRHKDKARLVWADAICIDQNDVAEKGSQVRVMGRIYGNAKRVCIWLGEATEQMQPAFGLIDEIASHESPQSINSTSSVWPALEIFFSAAWFERLWVVQEVYGNECTVFCGEREIPWKDVVLVAKWLLFSSRKAGRYTNAYYGHVYQASHVLQIESAGRDSSTSGVFDMFRSFRCSDQRDRVYAMLAFPPVSELRPLIQPDYSKSVAEVFEEATVRTFNYRQNLGLLSSLEHDCVIDENWPSWVPRWDRIRTTQILHNYASGRAGASLPRIKCKPKILISEGVRISTLSWCGGVIRQDTTKSVQGYGKRTIEHLNQRFQEWLSQYLPKITDAADPLLLHIAMTLTVGLDWESHCPPQDLFQFRLDFLSYLVEVLSSLKIISATPDLAQVLEKEASAGNPSIFYDAADRGSRNKRFFCTPNGEFGICPRAAHTGDYIVLLYGSNAPCVLRPKGPYFQFIGECYLHQHMHGEAIEMAAKGLLPIEEFELR